MTTTMKSPAAPRTATPRRQSPSETGQPDPRPVTDYTAAISTVSLHSRLTITLSQPCVIRQPLWPVIETDAGTLAYPTSVTVVNNTTFYLDFPALLLASFAFVQVPYQDMQVQNFQGGFVRPGGQWFRQPK